MEVILLFILSGAVSWGLSALVLLAFLHALGRATASSDPPDRRAAVQETLGPFMRTLKARPHE